jgi:hypothetical protein
MSKIKMMKAAAKAAKAAKAMEVRAPITPAEAKDVLAEMVGETKVETKVPTEVKPITPAEADEKPAVVIEAKKAEKPPVVEREWEYPGLPTGLSFEDLKVGMVVWGIKNLTRESPLVFPKLERAFHVMKMTVLTLTGTLFPNDDEMDFSEAFGLPILARTDKDGKIIEPLGKFDGLLLGDGREEMFVCGEAVDPDITGNLVFTFDDAGKAAAEAAAKFLNARGKGLFLNAYIAQLKRDAILSSSNAEKVTEYLMSADIGSIWRAKTVFDGLAGETNAGHKSVRFPKGLDRKGMVDQLLGLRQLIKEENRVAYNAKAKDLHLAAVAERNELDKVWNVPEGRHLGDSETATEQSNRKRAAAKAAEKLAATKSKAVKAAEGAKIPTIDEMRALVAAADAKRAEAALKKTDLQAAATTVHTAKKAVRDVVKIITKQ